MAKYRTPEEKIQYKKQQKRRKMLMYSCMAAFDLSTRLFKALNSLENPKQLPGSLKDIPDIEIVNLSHKDVVRHPLITEIIKAYTKHEENNKASND